MKQLVFALAAVLGCVLLPGGMAYADDEQQVIVVYENAQGEEAVRESGATVEENYRSLSAAEIKADAETVKELEQDPSIKYVEKNSKFTKTETTPVVLETPAEQWNLEAVQAEAAWEDGITGAGVKVAVLDSGISLHPDLAIAGGYAAVDYTDSYADDEGHGTHIAGIIAAQGTSGIAPDAALYAVKVLDQSGEGVLSDLLEGIDWAIENDMDIINMSMGANVRSEALQEAVDRAYQAGIVLVAASGNGSGAPVEYPAAYGNVIAVSAIDENYELAAFSSVGEEVEFAAPGKAILSTYPGSAYAEMSGTSQATAHVSGMLALLKQKFPEETNAQLRLQLQEYSKDLGVQGRDSLFGYGLIQYPSAQETVDLNEEKLAELYPVFEAMGMNEEQWSSLQNYLQNELTADAAVNEELVNLSDQIQQLGTIAIQSDDFAGIWQEVMDLLQLRADLFLGDSLITTDELAELTVNEDQELKAELYNEQNELLAAFSVLLEAVNSQSIPDSEQAEDVESQTDTAQEETKSTVSDEVSEQEETESVPSEVIMGQGETAQTSSEAGEQEDNRSAFNGTATAAKTGSELLQPVQEENVQEEKPSGSKAALIPEEEIVYHAAKTDETEENGQSLPNTAAGFFNVLTAGAILLIFGLIIYAGSRKSKENS